MKEKIRQILAFGKRDAFYTKNRKYVGARGRFIRDNLLIYKGGGFLSGTFYPTDEYVKLFGGKSIPIVAVKLSKED